MTLKNANLDGILSELRGRKAKLAGAQGDRDTTHPIADAPNSTETATTGARAAESSADVKDQQALDVESTGGPVDRENPSGSQGVEDKKSDEGADLDNGDTSGVSEMAEKDTTHPSKSASALEKAAAALDLLNKALEAQPEDKTAEDKTAEEKLAAYAKELETEHAEHVEHGRKFAEYALGMLAEMQGEQEKTAAEVYNNAVVIRHLLKTAASEEELAAMGDQGLDDASMQLAEQGITPEELEAELAGGAMGAGEMGEGGEEAEVAELLAAMEEAGITPEELEAALAEEEAGGALGGEMGLAEEEAGGALGGEMGLTPEDEEAALAEAMGETGVSPEELAQAEKLSADKSAAYTEYKNQLVRELQALKGASK